MQPTVYIETSIISYLRQRPAAQVVAAARQFLTQKWWDYHRADFDVVSSQYVVDEAALGDSILAAERLRALQGIPLLSLDAQVGHIAAEIMARAILPPKAQVDSLHIAIAAYHHIEYLLTWNCTHIANARNIPKINHVLTELGFPVPIICTPEEMIEDDPSH